MQAWYLLRVPYLWTCLPACLWSLRRILKHTIQMVECSAMCYLSYVGQIKIKSSHNCLYSQSYRYFGNFSPHSSEQIHQINAVKLFIFGFWSHNTKSLPRNWPSVLGGIAQKISADNAGNSTSLVFLYCCLDCPGCPAHLNSTGRETWAIWVEIKKHSLNEGVFSHCFFTFTNNTFA